MQFNSFQIPGFLFFWAVWLISSLFMVWSVSTVCVILILLSLLRLMLSLSMWSVLVNVPCTLLKLSRVSPKCKSIKLVLSVVHIFSVLPDYQGNPNQFEIWNIRIWHINSIKSSLLELFENILKCMHEYNLFYVNSLCLSLTIYEKFHKICP